MKLTKAQKALLNAIAGNNPDRIGVPANCAGTERALLRHNLVKMVSDADGHGATIQTTDAGRAWLAAN